MLSAAKPAEPAKRPRQEAAADRSDSSSSDSSVSIESCLDDISVDGAGVDLDDRDRDVEEAIENGEARGYELKGTFDSFGVHHRVHGLCGIIVPGGRH